MDRAVRRDIQKRYKRITKEYKGDADEVFCYTCDNCGQTIKVRQKDKGIAPMGIACPFCNGDALNAVDTARNIPVTHEWYRPSLDEVMKMAEEGRMFMLNFVLSGGLVRRKIQDAE